MISQLLNRPVTIRVRTAGDVDVYNDPTSTTADVQTVGYLDQRLRSEDESDGAQTQEDRWRLMVPADTTVTGWDAVVVADVVYEVFGPPWQVWNPRTRRVSHVEATLRRTV